MAEPSNQGGGSSIGAAATPIAGLIGSFLGYRSAKKNTERTIQANRELAEYQYSKDLEMWHRQNEYNSPQAQMERLKKAGLNPNLVYGNGAVGNTSGALPHYNAPTADYTGIPPIMNPGSLLQMYQDMRLKQAQTDNVQAQTDAVNVQTGIKAAFGMETAETELGRKKHDLDIKRHVDPLKASITESQMQAAKHLEEIAVAKLNNILQQNQNLKAGEQATRTKTKRDNVLLRWLEKGITPGDNLFLRILGQAINTDALKGAANKLYNYGAPKIKKEFQNLKNIKK